LSLKTPWDSKKIDQQEDGKNDEYLSYTQKK